jgi:RNA polymerase sigma-70 factor (ECF subfamily)
VHERGRVLGADDLPQHLATFLPRLWRFGLRLARSPHDAEDLVQRTCVRALERRAQLHPGAPPLPWLFSIMHSIWLNELRARKTRAHASLDLNESEPRPVVPALSDPETSLLYKQVIDAVEELPEAQRTVLLLVAVEGMTYRETADVLGLPIGTVMSRLARARLIIGRRFSEQAARSTLERPLADR